MNLKNRVINLEQTRLRLQLDRLIENIRKIPADALNHLFERLADERERRGLVEKPEIEAAKCLFGRLTEEEMPAEDALEAVLQAAKNNGFELTADDILG